MFRVLISLIIVLTVSISNWIRNPFDAYAAEIKHQKAPVNIIIPDDVMTEFLSAPQNIKEKHCRANNNYPYQEIHGLKNHPVYSATTAEWITVKSWGAVQTDEFVLRMATLIWIVALTKTSKAMMHSTIGRSWHSKTKPCAKNGSICSCTEWTDQMVRTSQIKRTIRQCKCMMHMAYGYFSACGSNSDDLKHKKSRLVVNF